MSGFEILGAVGTSLAITRHVIDTIRWVKQEHDVWKRAPQEMQELLVYATFTEICLAGIKPKLESIVVRITLEQDELWRKHATFTLETSEKLLGQIQAHLPPETELQKRKQTFSEKLNASFNAEKTINFTTRLNNLNQQLKELRDCPPLQAHFNPENESWYAKWIQGRSVIACADWIPRSDKEFPIEKGDQLVLRGTVTNGWVEVRYYEDDHNIPAREQDIMWKWVPDRCVQLCWGLVGGCTAPVGRFNRSGSRCASTKLIYP